MVQIVAGFQVVRLLGTGGSADVYLGTSTGGTSAAHPDGVALKVYRDATPRGRVENEIAALASADHRHVMRLLDLGSHTGEHPVLVLERLTPFPLHRLFDRGEPLTAGEVVTVCAPLVSAVRHLHDRGVCHGRLRAGAVLFDRSGAPVLTGFTHSRRMHTDVTREYAAATSADLNALDTLVATVVENSAVVGRSRLPDRRNNPGTTPPGAWLDELETALFDLAGAEPVRFTIEAQARLVAAGIDLPARDSTQDARGERLGAALRSLHIPDALDPLVDSLHARLGPIAERVRFELSRVRRAVWIGGTAAAAILSLAFVAIPAIESSSDASAEPRGEPSPTSGVTQSTDAQASPPPSAAAETEGDDVAESEALIGDDPISAAHALLEERSACFADLSVRCLAEVDHSGSALEDSDAYLIRDMLAGGAAPPPVDLSDAEPTLVDRTGASALVSVTDSSWPADSTPVSVHLIRTPDGWRLRDIIEH